MNLRALATIALVAASAASARAAPPTDDPEAAAEATSRFWGDAVDPTAPRRRAQVADAVRTLRLTNPELSGVERDLVALTAAAPDDADAWGYLALVAERRRSWRVCGQALRVLSTLAPTWRPDPSAIPGRSRTAIARSPAVVEATCWAQARAYREAAAVIERAIDRGDESPDLWLVAGQVAIGEGRLADAVAALDRAGGGFAPWLTILALDRAGREVDLAAFLPNQLDDRSPPWTSERGLFTEPGDDDYALAVAARRKGRPERALVFYRRYLARAEPTAPWRPAAAAWVARLAPTPLTASLTFTGSDGDTRARAEATAAVVAAAPTVAACLADLPTALLEVSVTVVGPPPRPIALKPSPFAGARPTARPHGGGRTVTVLGPDPGRDVVRLAIAPVGDGDGERRNAALACAEAAARAIALPKPRPGDYLTVRWPARAR